MMFHPQNHDPSIDLRPFGWAPGDYVNGTCNCGDTIYGAKRCTRCYDCAMKTHTKYHSQEVGELRLLRDRAEELQDDLRFYQDIERMNQKLKKDTLTNLMAVRRQICAAERGLDIPIRKGHPLRSDRVHFPPKEDI